MSDAAFAPVRATLQRFIDAQVLPGASFAVLRGDRVVHSACLGWADVEARVPLREDHVFRVFSNSKLVTACAALLLADAGRLALDAPIARYLPAFSRMRVLRPDASTLADTEPAHDPITVRHLLTHTAGFSYATVRPGTPLGDAYASERILMDQDESLAAFCDKLARLPLLFHPGTGWEYSVCSDVLAHVLELAGGQEFSALLRDRLFRPLGMVDTGFWLPPEAQHRLVRFYRSRHPDHPFRGGLEPCDELPFRDAYLGPRALRSGGGGLVSTLPDMTALLRSLVSPRHALLSPASRAALLRNQLPPGVSMRFPRSCALTGRGYSLGGAVTARCSPLDPAGAQGELQWGGIAGTHWWVSPATGSAVALMTQRYLGFWHLFAFQARRDVYAALGALAAAPMAPSGDAANRAARPYDYW